MAADIFSATMAMLKAEKEMNADREKLVEVCCGPLPLVNIRR
jgi:hypothetical protein